MSAARRHDVLNPPAPRRREVAPAPEWAEPEPAHVERRLTQQIFRLGARPGALVELLARAPALERSTARLVLIRLLGADRAEALAAQAWGPETRAEPAARPRDRSAPDAAALGRYERAQKIKTRVVRALKSGAHARPASLLALLSAAERPVALSALWMLHRTELPDGRSNALAALDGITAGAASKILRRGPDDPPDLAPVRAALAEALGRSRPAPAEVGAQPLALHRVADGSSAPPALDALARVGRGMASLFSATMGRWAKQLGVASPMADDASGVADTVARAARPTAERVAAQALALARTGACGPLPFRAELEAQFGKDLGSVECYFGAPAEAACQAVGAHAFTVGNVVVFSSASPSREVVAHEITHVLQQGGDRARLGAAPDELTVSRPGDAAEREAEHASGARAHGDSRAPGAEQVAGHAPKVTGAVGLFRFLNVAGAQPGALADLVAGVVPAGYTQKFQQYTQSGADLGQSISGTKDVINSATAFPVGDVKSLFKGSSYSFLNPKKFMEGLKPTGDNFLEKTVNLVLGICEKVLGVLDGVLGIVNKILGVVKNILDLLKKVSQVLGIIVKVLRAIAAALAATLFGAALAGVLFHIAQACSSIQGVIETIANAIQPVVDAIEKVVGTINKIKTKVEKVASIAKILKSAFDIYHWLTAKTSEERKAAADDIKQNSGALKAFFGRLFQGRFTQFASKFWQQAQPMVSPLENVINFKSSGGAGGGGAPSKDSAPAAAPKPAPEQPVGTEEPQPQPTAQDAGNAYKEFEDDAKKSAPRPASPPTPAEEQKQKLKEEQQRQENIKKTEAEASSAASQARAPTPPQLPSAPEEASNDLSALNVPPTTIVSGAKGVSATGTSFPLATASPLKAQPNPGGLTQPKDAAQKYPSGAGQIFEYLQNVVDFQKNADQLKSDGERRQQEAAALKTDADNTKQGVAEAKQVSADQRKGATEDRAANTEGIQFNQKIQVDAQKTQTDVQQKIDESDQANDETHQEGEKASDQMDSAGGKGESGFSSGMGAAGIIKKVATALLKSVLNKLIAKVKDGIIKKLIPGKLQQVFQLIMSFKSFAMNAKNQAKAKEAEAKGAEAKHEAAKAADEKAIEDTQASDAQADQISATASETSATASRAEEQGKQEIQKSDALKQQLVGEQANMEGKLAARLQPYQPLRNRVEPPPQIDAALPAVTQQWTAGGAATAAPAGGTPATGTAATPTGGTPATGTAATPTGGTPATGTAATPTGGTPATGTAATPTGGTPATGTAATPTGGTPATGTAATPTPSTAPGPTDLVAPPAVSATPQAAAAPAAAGAPSSSAATGALFTIRDPGPDQAELDSKVQQRAVDPSPPPAAQAQVQSIQQPAQSALGVAQAAHQSAVTDEKGKLPSKDGLLATVKPLPTVKDPGPDVLPKALATDGMGLGDKRTLTDAESKHIASWADDSSKNATLLVPAASPTATLPKLEAKKVPPSAKTAVPPTNAAPLPNVPPVLAPKSPIAVFQSPDVQALAGDVAGKEIVRDKFAKVKGAADRISDGYKAQEDSAVKPVQSQIDSAQKTQQVGAASALSQRNTEVTSARQQLGQQRDQVVGEAETTAQTTHETKVREASTRLETGQKNVDQRMRQGEQDAKGVETQAHTAETSERAQAKTKAEKLWGWFTSTAEGFVRGLTEKLSSLWGLAKQGIQLALTKARNEGLGIAANALLFAMDPLGWLGGEVVRLFAGATAKLTQYASAALNLLTRSITGAAQKLLGYASAARDAITGLLHSAWNTVKSIAATVERGLVAAWDAFKTFVDQVRRAPGRFVEAIQRRASSGQWGDYWDKDHKGLQPRTGIDSGGTQWWNPVSANAPLMQALDRHGGNAATAIEERYYMTPVINLLGEGRVNAVANIYGKLHWPDIYLVVNTPLKNYVSLPPSQQLAAYLKLGPDVTVFKNDQESKFQGALPELRVETQGANPGAVGAKVAPPPKSSVHVPELAGSGAAPKTELPAVEQPPLPARTASDASLDQVGDDVHVDDRAAKLGEQIESVEEGCPVNTNLPPAGVNLTGAADPGRIDAHAQALTASLDQAHTDEGRRASQVANGERVQPIALQASGKLSGLLQPKPVQLAAIPELQETVELTQSPTAKAAFDESCGPPMQAQYQQVEAQLDQATAARDQERKAEFTDIESRLQSEEQKVKSDQDREVQAARSEIVRDRDETLAKHKQAVDQQRARLDQERSTRRKQIEDRAKQDQTRIDGEYQKAQTNAQAAVTKGQADARAEKAKARAEGQQQSWWEKACRWVIDRLKDAVQRILEGVRAAVHLVIDAARAVVKGIIDVAVEFACTQIKAFAEVAKAVLQSVIGDLLPLATQALCNLIDAKVGQVCATLRGFGDRLKQGVDQLAAGAKQRLDAALTRWDQAVQHVLDGIKSVLAGGLKDAPRKIFEAILRRAGVDPALAYRILAAAGGALLDLITTLLRTNIDVFVSVLKSLPAVILAPGAAASILLAAAFLGLPEGVQSAIIDLILDAAIKFVGAMGSIPALGFVWMLVRPYVIGFLQGVKGRAAKEKRDIVLRLAKIMAGQSLGFIKGFIEGVVKAVVDAVKEPFEALRAVFDNLLSPLIVGLLSGQGVQLPMWEKAKFLVERLKARMAALAGELRAMLTELLANLGHTIVDALLDAKGGDLRGAFARLGDFGNRIYGQIEKMGAQFANSVCDFFLDDKVADEELGKKTGELVGAAAIEIALFFGTAAEGTIAKYAGRGGLLVFRLLNWKAETLGLCFKALEKAGEAAIEFGTKLVEWFGTLAQKVSGVLTKIGNRLIAEFQGLMTIAADLVKEARALQQVARRLRALSGTLINDGALLERWAQDARALGNAVGDLRAVIVTRLTLVDREGAHVLTAELEQADAAATRALQQQAAAFERTAADLEQASEEARALGEAGRDLSQAVEGDAARLDQAAQRCEQLAQKGKALGERARSLGTELQHKIPEMKESLEKLLKKEELEEWVKHVEEWEHRFHKIDPAIMTGAEWAKAAREWSQEKAEHAEKESEALE